MRLKWKAMDADGKWKRFEHRPTRRDGQWVRQRGIEVEAPDLKPSAQPWAQTLTYEGEGLEWPEIDSSERRMDIIGQNGNEGLHYGQAEGLAVQATDREEAQTTNQGDYIISCDLIYDPIGNLIGKVVDGGLEFFNAIRPGPVVQLADTEECEANKAFWREVLDSAPALSIQEGGSHYKSMKIQPFEYIHANGIPFAEGNVIKYVSRWRNKNGIEDLKKARHFLDLLIEAESEK